MDADAPSRPAGQAPFRVTFVTGVMPDKWARRWRERERAPLALVPVEEPQQLDALRAGEASMALVREPAALDGLHRIPLYVEDVVALVSREHPAAAYDSLSSSELSEERVLEAPPLTLPELVASVAADAGVAFLPRSVARAHHRRDVAVVAVPDLPGRPVCLVWPVDADDPLLETFVGVVRGRTARSSRGTPAAEVRRGRRRRGT